MIIEVILLIFYKFLLDYTYADYVGVIYAYQGFNVEFNLIKFLESSILVTIMYIFYRFNNKEDHVSNIILLVLIVSLFVPYSSLYGMENTSRTFYYIIFVGFITTIAITKMASIKITTIYLLKDRDLIKVLIAFSIVIFSLVVIIEGTPSIQAFNLNNVYEIRGENSIPRWLSYFLNWQTKVISLFVIGYGLYYKKTKLVLVMLVLQALIYGVTAHKIVLFAPVLLVIFYIILRLFNNFKLAYILLMNIGVVLTFLFYKLNLSEWPATLFIRRMLFVPVKNTNYVFDFFYDIEKIKLSNSILKGIFMYPFDKAVYYMIGERYYNNSATNANASYLGDAYLQFGVIGILLYSILLGLLLWILKSITVEKPTIIVLGAVLIGFYSIIDSSLLTSMLTNGIIMGLFLCLVLKKPVNTG